MEGFSGIIPFYQGRILVRLGDDGYVRLPMGKRSVQHIDAQTANIALYDQWGNGILKDPNWTRRAFKTNTQQHVMYLFQLTDVEYGKLMEAKKNIIAVPMDPLLKTDETDGVKIDTKEAVKVRMDPNQKEIARLFQ